MAENEGIRGHNGIAVTRRAVASSGYRTYEVHQRERVGESTALVKPMQFVAADFARDPYPLLTILRENYPCCRNWATNSYWITQYNDVTSIFADEANFETRSKRWYYGIPDYGRDLREHLDVLRSHEAYFDANAGPLSARLVDDLVKAGGGDLAAEFAGSFAYELLLGWVGIDVANKEWFLARYLTAQRGFRWDGVAQAKGIAALQELASFFDAQLAKRYDNEANDLISVFARIRRDDGTTNGQDLAATLLEMDTETLHGALANLWYLLLTTVGALAEVRSNPLLAKFSFLEALRHSPPVLSADRFARHEVERFGKLLPEGALVICSAAAANRDPRIFSEPERFIVGRKDLCQREPRGQYRADGLASGIAFGLGKPSIHPAVPEDRPRSLYAITRDTAVTASANLLERAKSIELAGAAERPRSLRLGEMYACWRLPVVVQG